MCNKFYLVVSNWKGQGWLEFLRELYGKDRISNRPCKICYTGGVKEGSVNDTSIEAMQTKGGKGIL